MGYLVHCTQERNIAGVIPVVALDGSVAWKAMRPSPLLRLIKVDHFHQQEITQ